MKIALAQLNYHIGNFEKNVRNIKSEIEKAKTNKVDLIIFSELSVCGYPPFDLLEQNDFIALCKNSVIDIAGACVGIAAVVGSPLLNNNPRGKRLYNSAFFLADGKIMKVIHKALLPTYDIFDEYRYFEPNNEFDIVLYKGKRIAVTICEDLWDNYAADSSISNNMMYQIAPLDSLMSFNPDFVVNISASPFSYNREIPRKIVLGEKAAANNLPVFYVNQVGAQTELIFDGASMVLDSNGRCYKELASFKEDYLEIDLDEVIIKDHKPEKIVRDQLKKCNVFPADSKMLPYIYNALVLGVKDYFSKMSFKRATLGLSGGIDSAVTLVIASEALGIDNIKVLLMPSKYSSKHSVDDAVGLADNLNIKYSILYIEEIVQEFETVLSGLFKNMPEDITEENLQARIRGTLLMGFSNKFGHILLNTSNKSEAAVGYSTLYGDTNGGLSVLGDVYKTDVYRLAEYINREKLIIPQSTISKPPSAELRPGQKDSDSLPDYSVLDNILFNYIERNNDISEIIRKGFEKELVGRIVQMVDNNEYKRFQFPPILRISSKAFGTGRKMPLVANFFKK
ncbi:NAD+ synthase [Bacteroidota bacterium]